MARPDPKKMIRSFGLFVGIVCWVLGLYLSFKANSLRPVLPLVGSYFLVGGLLFQPILKPVFKIWMKIAHALGWFNMHVLLTLIFFLLFTPISWVQKLIRRDSLKLLRPTASSLWTPKAPAPSPNSYFRQF